MPAVIHNDDPSETSPLLPKDVSSSDDRPSTPLDASASSAVQGPLSASDGVGEAEDGEQVRPTDRAPDTANQYKGLPDVQKRMKYIFPAMAIGVCC